MLYAAVITFGWARTRRNRRILQSAAISQFPVFDVERWEKNPGRVVHALSLTTNKFLSASGDELSPSDYDVYIAEGESAAHPDISAGDLLFFAKGTLDLQQIFSIPELSAYR